MIMIEKGRFRFGWLFLALRAVRILESRKCLGSDCELGSSEVLEIFKKRDDDEIK